MKDVLVSKIRGLGTTCPYDLYAPEDALESVDLSVGMVVPHSFSLDSFPQIDKPPDDCVNFNGLSIGEDVTGKALVPREFDLGDLVPGEEKFEC